MSELLKELEGRSAGVEREPNLLLVLLETMDQEEREAVLKAIELVRTDTRKGKAKLYSSAWLSRVLTKNGYSISSTTIQRYLKEVK